MSGYKREEQTESSPGETEAARALWIPILSITLNHEAAKCNSKSKCLQALCRMPEAWWYNPSSCYGTDSNLWTPPLIHTMEGRCRSWSLSDSGWLWARSGLGVKDGGSGCWTDIVLRRWFLLRRKSGCEWRPKLPFLRIIRELFFLGREGRLNSREAKWAA